MKIHRYAVICILASMCIVLFGTLQATAFENCSGNFSRNYSLSGNYANDIISVANAQIGKTKAALGYNEDWCADFVMDCARIIGVPDSIIPYNNSGCAYVPTFYNTLVNNCGASVVNDPQHGDILFYYCSQCNGFKHVALVLDGTYSIEGNYWISGVSSVVKASSYWDDCNHSTNDYISRVYVRPKYLPSKPDSPNVKISQSAYEVGTPIHLSWNAVEGATDYLVEIWERGGKQLYSDNFGNLLFYNRYLDAGKYSAYVSAHNNNGYSTPKRVDFDVAKRAEAPHAKISQTEYDVSTPIYLSWDAVENADDYLVEIWEKDGKQLYSDNFGNLLYYSRYLPIGEYRVYVSSHNALGYTLGEAIDVKVYLPPPKVYVRKQVYEVGTPIYMFWDAVKGADDYLVEIWQPGVGQLHSDNFGNTLYYSRYLDEGEYIVYVSSHNSGGYGLGTPIPITIVSNDENNLSTTSILSNTKYHVATIDIDNPEDAALAIGIYDNEDRLLDIKTEHISSDTDYTTVEFPKNDNSKYVKVFVWNNFQNMCPLTYCETVQVQ